MGWPDKRGFSSEAFHYVDSSITRENGRMNFQYRLSRCSSSRHRLQCYITLELGILVCSVYGSGLAGPQWCLADTVDMGLDVDFGLV